jgi:hypothetical protein
VLYSDPSSGAIDEQSGLKEAEYYVIPSLIRQGSFTFLNHRTGIDF